MAKMKFGLYNAGSPKPLHEYEGDFLQLNAQGESVRFVVNDGGGVSHTVAVIRLAETQSVKPVKE
jgi:hypothetical protein